MNRQQICEKLITIVRNRIAELLTCTNNDLPELSLGRLINLLFLIRGETVSVGEYGASMAAAYKVVGDLLWKEPSEFAKDEAAAVVTGMVQ